MSTPRRRLRALALLLLGVPVLALGAALAVVSVDPLLGALAPRLVGLAGLDLEVGRVRHDLGRRLVIERARFGVPGEEPLVVVESIDLRYRLAGLLRGVIDVPAVRIRAPDVIVAFREDGSFVWLPEDPADEDETDDGSEAVEDPWTFELIPDFGLTIEVGEVEVSDGRFRLDDPINSIEIEAEGIRLVAGGVPYPTRLHANVRVERARFRDLVAGPIQLDGGLVGNRVDVRSLALVLPTGALGLVGHWDASSADIDATATLDGVTPAPVLATFGLDELPELPSGLSGEVGLAGTMPGPLTMRVDLEGRYVGSPLEASARARGSFTDLGELAARVALGEAEGRAKGRVDLAGDASDVEVELRAPSLAFLDPWIELEGLTVGDLRVAARVAGDLGAPRIEVREARAARVSYADLALTESVVRGDVALPDGPIAARADVAALDAGGVALGAGRVTAGGTLLEPELAAAVGEAIRVRGRYRVDDGRFALDAELGALELDPFLAIGVADGLGGRIEQLDAHLTGTATELASLRGTASVRGLSLVAEGQRIEQRGPVEARFEADGVTLKGALGLGDESRLVVDARSRLAERWLRARLELAVDGADLEPFARRFLPELEALRGDLSLAGIVEGPFDALVLDAEGSGSGLDAALRLAEGEGGLLAVQLPRVALDLAGPLTRPTGRIDLAEGRASFAGYGLGGLGAAMTLDAGVLDVASLAFDLEGLHLEGSGRLDPDGPLEARLETVDAELAQVQAFAEARIAGPLRLTARASGRLDDPVAELVLELPELRYRDAVLGGARLDAGLADGRLDARVGLPGGGTTVASLGLEEPRPVALDVAIEDLLLDPFFEALADLLPNSLVGASGRIALDGSLSGSLDAPESLEGELRLGTFSLAGAGFRLALREPSEIPLRDGEMRLTELAFDVGVGEVVLDGRVSPRATDLRVAVDVDPAAVNGLVKEVEIRPGRVRTLEDPLELRWRADEPIEVSGLVGIELEALSVRGYPYTFEAIDAELRLDGSKATLRTPRRPVRVADGRLEIDVAADLEQRRVERARFEFVELPYRVPGTFRMLVSGTLEASGSAESAVVRGRVRVDDALYDRDVQVLQGLIRPLAGRTQTRGASEPPPAFLDNVRLDLRIESGETIAIRNNVAQLVASTDVSLFGTAARPRLLGQARVVEGTVQFFDRVFELERGSIDFQNPLEIDPVIDVEARTTVFRERGNVDVTLRLSGTVSEGLELTLDSDPAFPQDDIAFLLTTGTTRSEALSGSSSDTSMRGLSLAALSLIGGGEIKDRLGLEEFGLEEGDDGQTRVTVGTRLSDRVRVRAVNEFGRGQAEVALALEYELTDTIVLVAEPQTTGAFRSEIRLRFRFR